MNKKDPKSRSWLLTIPEADYDKQTVENKLGKYAAFVGQLEQGGKTGYRHWQVLLEHTQVIRFSTLHNLFPKAHIEIRRGTKAQAVAYCTKEETALGVRIGKGKIATEEDVKEPSRLAKLHSMILSGESLDDVLVKDPTAWHFANNLSRLEQSVIRRRSNRMRNVETFYLYGETGVGKTSGLFAKYGLDGGMYRVSDYSHPWDSYRGEKILVLDEFYGNNVRFDFLLNVLDGYPQELPARYGNKFANWDRVYLVSNVKLEQQYPEIQRMYPKSWQALVRRIKNVVEVKEPADVP